jgi:hypothetical protein
MHVNGTAILSRLPGFTLGQAEEQKRLHGWAAGRERHGAALRQNPLSTSELAKAPGPAIQGRRRRVLRVDGCVEFI